MTQPKLIPVDGDPFAAATPAKAPKLVPIQGDPFAQPAPKPAPAPEPMRRVSDAEMRAAAEGMFSDKPDPRFLQPAPAPDLRTVDTTVLRRALAPKADPFGTAAYQRDKNSVSTGTMAAPTAGDIIGNDYRGERIDVAHPGAITDPGESWAAMGGKIVDHIIPGFKASLGGAIQGMAENQSDVIVGPDGTAQRIVLPDNLPTGPTPGEAMQREANADLERTAFQPGDNLAKYYAGALADSLIQMVPSIGATILTRSPQAGMATMFGQVGGQQYGQSRAEARTPDQASADALFMGATEILGEHLPLSRILGHGGDSLLHETLKTAGIEGAQEALTQVLQTGYSAGVLNKDMTLGEAVRQVIDAGIVGTGAGAAMHVAAHPFNGSAPEVPSAPAVDVPALASPEPAPATVSADPYADIAEPVATRPVPAPAAVPKIVPVDGDPFHSPTAPLADEAALPVPEATGQDTARPLTVPDAAPAAQQEVRKTAYGAIDGKAGAPAIDKAHELLASGDPVEFVAPTGEHASVTQVADDQFRVSVDGHDATVSRDQLASVADTARFKLLSPKADLANVADVTMPAITPPPADMADRVTGPIAPTASRAAAPEADGLTPVPDHDYAHAFSLPRAELEAVAQHGPHDAEVDEGVLTREMASEILREHQDYPAFSDDALIDTVRRTIIEHREPAWLDRVQQGKGHSGQQAAFVRLGGAMAELRKRGQFPALRSKLQASLVAHGWNPADAAEVLDHRLEGMAISTGPKLAPPAPTVDSATPAGSMLHPIDAPAHPDARRRAAPAREAEAAASKPRGSDRNRDAGAQAEDAPAADGGAYAQSRVEASFTNRQSVYESAVHATGLTPDNFNILPPARKVALLTRALEQLTGIKATLSEKMPPQFAIDQLLDAHQTLQGMASVLGIVPQALSLDGKLSLQLIKGASWLGQFQPGTNVITLPGRSNSFAHEWAHALDWYLLGKVSSEKAAGLTGLIRNDGADFQPANVSEAFVNVLNSMFFDGAALAHKIMELQRKIAISGSERQRAGLQAQIDNILSGQSRAKEKSRYWQGSNLQNKAAGGGDYWTKPTEMFARAFEGWIAFKTANESFGSEFITKGDDFYADASKGLVDIYPKAEERVAIFDAMQKLLDAVNDERLLRGAAPGPAPTPAAARQASRVRSQTAQAKNRLRRMVDKVLGPDIEAFQIGRANKAIDEADAARRLPDPMRLIQKAANVRSLAFSAASDGVKMVAERWNSPAALTIHDHFAHDLGGTRHVDRVWTEAVTLRENKALNPIMAELKKHGSKGWIYKKLDQEQRDVLRELLTGKDVADDLGLTRLASMIRRAYNDEWYHNQNAGIDLGYVKDTAYLNRQTDRELVAGDPDGFLDKATQVYEIDFDRKVGASGAAIAADAERLEAFIDTAKAREVEGTRALRRAISDKADEGAIATMVDDMVDEVRTAYAVNAAAEYRDAILHTETFPDYTPTSRIPNSEKQRTLPAEADDLLADFYNPDPIASFAHYVSNSVRRTEWARRFGHDGAKGKKLDEAMAAEGVPEADRRYVWMLADRMAGRYRRTGFLANPGVAGALSALRVKGTLAMMGRAVTLSLFEPASLGIVTANPKYGFSAVAKTWANVLLKGSRDEQMEWARAQGFIKHNMLEQMQSMDRFGTHSDTPSRLDHIPAAMFRNSGLTFLTDASDAAIADVGRRSILNDMSYRVIAGGKRGAEAEKLMSELGIRDPRAFARQIVDMGDAMPSDEWMRGPGGWDYNTALMRLTKMTIQKPSPADLAPLGRNPLASYATYSITAFIQASYRHLFKRNVKIAARHAMAGDYDLFARFALGTLASVGVLYGLNLLSSMGREELFNPDRQREWEKAGNYWRNNAALAASRTFSFGAVDPMISAYTGLQYNRSLAFLPLGAYAGNDAQNVDKMVKIATSNSRKTNTAEHNALQGLYGFAIAPAISAGLNSLPAGPLATTGAGAATAALTSPQAAKGFASALVGKKNGREHSSWTPTAYDKRLNAALGPVKPKPKQSE